MINLYPFQKKVLKETECNNKVAYYLDMGLGKTFVGSEKLIQLGSKTNLVISDKLYASVTTAVGSICPHSSFST